MFHTSEISYIDNNNNNTILLKRLNKKNIIIRMCEEDNNISQSTIDTFIQLLFTNNCNGIIVSNNSDFVSKSDFLIENYYGNSLIYIPKMVNDINKIKIAINATDAIMTKMREYEKNTNDYAIEKTLLNDIYNEYQQFIFDKENMIETMKDEHKKCMNHLHQGFRFSVLENFLTTKMIKIPKKDVIKCSICNSYCAHNLKALSAHKRGCSKKNIVPAYELEDYKT
jgi:hypothetical protein